VKRTKHNQNLSSAPPPIIPLKQHKSASVLPIPPENNFKTLILIVPKKQDESSSTPNPSTNYFKHVASAPLPPIVPKKESTEKERK